MAAAVQLGWRRPGSLTMLERLSSRLYRCVDTAAAYLITAGDRAIAIDAGDAGLLGHLESIGVRQVEWVLHTHHHRDCCQGDDRMVEHGARIAAPEPEAHLLDRVESFWQTRQTRGVYDLHSDAFSVARNVPVARRLADYEVFEWADVRLLVLPTPGHTAGSVTFLGDIDGVLWGFSGDLVTAPGRPWTVHDLQWDYNEPSGLNVALQSAEVLHRRRPAMLGPSHGPVIADVPGTLESLTASLTRLYALLGRGWGDAEPPPRPVATELRAERVSDHLITVSSSVACFHVLHRGGRALLFDYGFASWDHIPGARSRFVEHSIDELREGFGIGSIEVAVATHYHDDHVAGLPHLRREHGAEIWAHEAFADVLESPERRRLPCLPRTAVPVDRRLRDGETVEWAGFEITARHLPGHTHYASALFMEVDGHRVAVTGDQLEPDGHGVLRGGGPVHRNRMAAGDFRRGIDMLIDWRPDVLLTGHAGAVRVDRATLSPARDWALELKSCLRQLGGDDGEQLGRALDPDHVAIVPYEATILPGGRVTLEVEVRNHADGPRTADVRLHVPDGWMVEPDRRRFDVDGGAMARARFELQAPSGAPHGIRHVVTADVALGDVRYGEAAEALVELGGYQSVGGGAADAASTTTSTSG